MNRQTHHMQQDLEKNRLITPSNPMNSGLKKLVDQGFMTEEQANYIDEAVENKSTIFVSGHKGWGILPLLATIGTMAKEKYSVKQVKGFECLAEASDCYVIAAPKETDMEQLVMLPNPSKCLSAPRWMMKKNCVKSPV